MNELVMILSDFFKTNCAGIIAGIIATVICCVGAKLWNAIKNTPQNINDLLNNIDYNNLNWKDELDNALQIRQTMKSCFPEYKNYLLIQYGSSVSPDSTLPSDYDFIVLMLGYPENEVRYMHNKGTISDISEGENKYHVDIVFRDYFSFLFAAAAGMPYENSVITGGQLIKGPEGYFQWLKNITKNNLFDRDFLIRRYRDKISIEKQEFKKCINEHEKYGLDKYYVSILSKKMAGMELDCRCDESRDDEIGVLASSLNELVQNLAKSLEELKVANDFLQLDIDRERELDRQRMAFFSAVSHELKTPITALQGQLDGMLQNYGSYKDRDKYLAKSLAIAQSMERTIQEIVTISRLDASDFSLGRADFDFSELVRVIAAEYIDFIEQKDMELDINISEHITVNADEKMMKKVLSNLFSNAIRHSPRGEQIVVTSFLKNGCVYFSILNTGVQIKEEAISHLYEVFYRADDSRSRRTGGSGLGLYIVKRILEQHSAQFSIQNLNDGVEFWFSL